MEHNYEVLLEPTGSPNSFSTIICRHPSVRCVFGSRSSLARVDATWENPGFYLLLEELQPTDIYGAYVGQAKSLRTRLSNHRANKEFWNSAILIQSGGVQFNENHISYLEAQMHSILRNAHLCETTHNEQGTSALTCSAGEREWLDDVIELVVRILRTFGFETAEAEELTAQTDLPLTRRKIGVTLQDLYNRGLLIDGEVLTSSSQKFPRQAIFRAPGCIEIDGEAFDNVSSAAASITGYAMNGWKFWVRARPDDKIPFHVLRARVEAMAGTS